MISKEDADLLKNLLPEKGLNMISIKFSEEIVFSTSLGHKDQGGRSVVFKNQLVGKVFTSDKGRFFYGHDERLTKNNTKNIVKKKVYFPEVSEVEDDTSTIEITTLYHSLKNRKKDGFIRKIKSLLVFDGFENRTNMIHAILGNGTSNSTVGAVLIL